MEYRYLVTMRSKVYIETSIVSYYTSRPNRDLVTAARQQVTRDWWEDTRSQFEAYISPLVLDEAADGDTSAAQKRLDALTGMPVLQITDEAEKLAETMVKAGVMPPEHSEDSLHIALATVNGMDFLLKWNFTHINNAVMKKEIIRVIEDHGYQCPVICSPDELTGE